MEIAELGEFGLIDRLTNELKIKNTSTVYGVGDDCAVLNYPDKQVLVTTDLLMEGVHFDLTYTDLRNLGYKSAMVNLSDVFAMNGTPKQLTVSMAVSKRFTVEDMEQFYEGLRAGMWILWEAIPPLRSRALPSASPVSVRPTSSA